LRLGVTVGRGVEGAEGLRGIGAEGVEGNREEGEQSIAIVFVDAEHPLCLAPGFSPGKTDYSAGVYLVSSAVMLPTLYISTSKRSGI
jgi:hypothetical protein